MEPRTIVILTALALAALALEYFTSAFHRGWSAFRGPRLAGRQLPDPIEPTPFSPAADFHAEAWPAEFARDAHVAEPPLSATTSDPLATPTPRELRVIPPPNAAPAVAAAPVLARAAEFSGPHEPELREALRPEVSMPPPDSGRHGSNGVAAHPDAPHANGSAYANGGAPVVPAPPREVEVTPAAALTPEARAEMRVAEEIAVITGELSSIAGELARDSYLAGVVPALRRLKARAVEYDLDGLMDIADGVLNEGVIAYHRDVARTVLELEKLVRDAALIRSLANGHVRLEQVRKVLTDDVADEIARGARLTSRLRRHGAGVAQTA